MATKTVLLIQGLFYLMTAIWPLVHIRSFEKITGPKQEHWLVYTVAVMILCSSLVFLSAATGPFMVGKEVIILSLSNIIALAGIDIVFVFKRIISKVYLLDALAELALAVMLIASL